MRYYLEMVSGLCLAMVMEAYPVPLERGHAHNDYEHSRPLWDALEAGFCSVEADIYLVDGELLVAHDRKDVVKGETLSKLYLKPMADLATKHGGRVYPGWPEVTLLVDIKAEGKKVFPYLLQELYKVRHAVGRKQKGAFRVVLSGDRPIPQILGDSEMWTALDGRPEDLGKGYSARQMPLVSTSWVGEFALTPVKGMVGEKAEKLRSLVSRVHAEGRRIRYWALPDTPAFWELAYIEGVDLINTDKPDDLAKWLSSRRK